MEFLWSIAGKRRIRLPIWFGLAAGTGASALWLPLMLHLSKYNSGDTTASDFSRSAHAKPSCERDVHSIFAGSDVFFLFILATVLVVSAAFVISLHFREIRRERLPAPPKALDGNEVLQIAVDGFRIARRHCPSASRWPLASPMSSSGAMLLLRSSGAILLFVVALSKVPYQRSVEQHPACHLVRPSAVSGLTKDLVGPGGLGFCIMHGQRSHRCRRRRPLSWS